MSLRKGASEKCRITEGTSTVILSGIGVSERNVLAFWRSVVRRSTSMSAIANCGLVTNRAVLARQRPFSQIIPFPAYTTSVDDSPNPADE